MVTGSGSGGIVSRGKLNATLAVEIRFDNQHVISGCGPGFLGILTRENQCARPGVFEVKLELLASVRRVQGRSRANCRRRQKLNDHFDSVWQGHRNAIVAAQTSLTQFAGQPIYLRTQLIVSEFRSACRHGERETRRITIFQQVESHMISVREPNHIWWRRRLSQTAVSSQQSVIREVVVTLLSLALTGQSQASTDD